MTLAWHPSMETGAPTLDGQHRVLVERAAELVRCIEGGEDRQVVETALRDFGDYAVRYFSTEEDCSLRGVCPALRWNGDARADLIRLLAAFRVSYEREGSTASVAQALSGKMADWVARYIPGPASLMRPCVPSPR